MLKRINTITHSRLSNLCMYICNNPNVVLVCSIFCQTIRAHRTPTYYLQNHGQACYCCTKTLTPLELCDHGIPDYALIRRQNTDSLHCNLANHNLTLNLLTLLCTLNVSLYLRTMMRNISKSFVTMREHMRKKALIYALDTLLK